MKTGLVLEGGGLRGMFTSGVIDALLEEDIRFDGMIGVSAGALFGCNLKSKQHAIASKIGLPRPPKDRADAASMRKSLVEIKSNENYIVDELTHSVPYLIPSAKKELDAIGAEWADILSRNGLPHYRFYVTSILRTQEDVKYLQRSGNINSTTQSCHCYGTTFDLAYMRYEKVTCTRDYMHEDNLKLVLGQVLLNHQRAGKIYVKYEWKQSCFHITVRN